jgi:hypothetical protein
MYLLMAYPSSPSWRSLLSSEVGQLRKQMLPGCPYAHGCVLKSTFKSCQPIHVPSYSTLPSLTRFYRNTQGRESRSRSVLGRRCFYCGPPSRSPYHGRRDVPRPVASGIWFHGHESFVRIDIDLWIAPMLFLQCLS